MRSLFSVTTLLLFTLTTYAASITGMIRDSETGRPIAAATVSAPKENRQTASDRDGLFQLATSSKKVKIEIQASGYYSREYVITDFSRPVSVSMKPELDHLEEGMGLVIGALLDSEIGTPIEKAEVFSAYSSFSKSDESGYFSMTGDASSTIQVNLRHPSYRDTTISVTFSDGRTAKYQSIRWTPKVLRASLAGSISGTILNESAKPLSGATVTVLNSDLVLQSSSKGAYSFDTLYAGKHTLLATALGYEPKILTITLNEKEKLPLNISLKPKSLELNDVATLKGKVFTPDAAPLPGATVSIDSLSIRVKTDGMGNYTIDSLPGGVFQLTATAEGYDETNVYDVDLWTGEVLNTDIVMLEKKTSDIPEFAKGNGGVVGVVVSAADGNPVVGAKIKLKDQNSSRIFESVTEPDGSFVIEAKQGVYSLAISGAGLKNNVSENVPVNSGDATKMDFIMESSDVNTMAKLTVRGVAVKSGNAALLKERQQSFEVVDAVGSEQFKKTGASDAADALKTVPGVTIVDGKFVVVRGLPPKYSVVMLNKTVLPSSNPDEQAVHMDMFPSGIIENISVYKTFQPIYPANFAGGVVNITTKPFPEERTFKVSLSGTYNSNTTFNDDFLTSNSSASEQFGFAGSHRAIPDIISETPKSVVNDNLQWTAISVDKNLEYGRDSVVEFTDKYSKSVSSEMKPHSKLAVPNISFSSSFGDTKNFSNGSKLGYNLSLTYKSERKQSDNIIERSFGVNGPDVPLGIDKDFIVTDAKEKAIWSLLGNTAFSPNQDHTFSLDYLLLKSGENKIKSVTGVMPRSEVPTAQFSSSRIQFVERTMNYFKGEGNHQMYGRNLTPSLYWRGAYTDSRQSEPDQRDIYEFLHDDGSYEFVRTMPAPSHSWRDVKTKQGTGDIGIKIPFYQWSSDSATITAGAAWQGLWTEQRIKKVEYDIYNYFSSISLEGQDPTLHPMDYYMNNENMGVIPDPTATSGKKWGLTLKNASSDYSQRDGTQQIVAQYAQLELPLNQAISTTVGVRGEYAYMNDQTIVEEKQVDSLAAHLNDYDVLPKVALTVKPTKKSVIKASYGKTLIRPSIRQMAQYRTASFTGGGSYEGNPDLVRSFNHNFDARWEFFPKPGALIATGGFYKKIKNPIEDESLSNDLLRPKNSNNDANIFGLELEFINRWKFSSKEQYIDLNTNVTFVYSRVNLDESDRKLPNYFPDEKPYRPYQGQSPIVANVLLSYGMKDIGFTSSLYYNVFGKRLGTLTAQEEPYLWEKPYHQLNLSLTKTLGEQITLGFAAKNMLNMTKTLYMEFNGEEYIKHQSQKGVDLSLGLSFTF